jgi:hypothetical protein
MDLKVTKETRYGFVQSYHGAFLVKTENIDLENAAKKDKGAKSDTQDKNNEEENSISDVSGSISKPGRTEKSDISSVAAAMREELELVPIKTVLEITLYLIAFLLIFWGPSGLIKMRFLPAFKPFWRQFWAGTISGAMCFWIMIMPLIMLNYGYPLFSTWIGPGALSYSTGTVPISYGGGLTVSYRMIADLLIFCPNIFYLSFAEYIPNWAQEFIFFGMFAPSLCGVIWGIHRMMWMDFRRAKQTPLLLQKS